MNILILSVDPKILKGVGAQIVIWNVYDQVVRVGKRWVEQEFVLFNHPDIAKWNIMALCNKEKVTLTIQKITIMKLNKVKTILITHSIMTLSIYNNNIQRNGAVYYNTQHDDVQYYNTQH